MKLGAEDPVHRNGAIKIIHVLFEAAKFMVIYYTA